MAISGRGSQALNSLGVARSTGGIQVAATASAGTRSRERHAITGAATTKRFLNLGAIKDQKIIWQL
jgi:hypothetical protein